MTLRLLFPAFLATATLAADTPLSAEISAAAYPSIQAALTANPGKLIFVPAGDHVIMEKIRIRGERSGLYGPGRIIQQNPEQPILEIENARSIEIRDVTLTRPEDKTETQSEAIRAQNCRDLVIENVKVINNRTKSGAILVTDSSATRISRCLVRNYMKVSVDDRTQGDVSGYAFRCTDGTGIMVRYCKGTLLESNHIIEETYLTPGRTWMIRHSLRSSSKAISSTILARRVTFTMSSFPPSSADRRDCISATTYFRQAHAASAIKKCIYENKLMMRESEPPWLLKPFQIQTRKVQLVPVVRGAFVAALIDDRDAAVIQHSDVGI